MKTFDYRKSLKFLLLLHRLIKSSLLTNQTVVDICRVSKGIFSNPYTKAFMSTFGKASDTKKGLCLSFNIIAVTTCCFILGCQTPKSNVSLVNFAFDEKLSFPVLAKTSFLFIIKYVAQKTKKLWVELYTATVEGTFQTLL